VHSRTGRSWLRGSRSLSGIPGREKSACAMARNSSAGTPRGLLRAATMSEPA